MLQFRIGFCKAQRMFDEILLFVKLVDAGSISKLAAHLAINKSTLSKQIAKLEEQLGQLLLIRHSNSFELTQYGKSLYNNFQRAETYLQNCLKKANQEHSNAIGSIRILCTHFMLRTLLKESLKQIYLKYPNINIELQTFTGIKDYDEYFDLALSFVKPTHPDLLVKRLYSIPTVLMASTKLAAEVADITTPEELFARFRNRIIWRSKDSQPVTSIVATETGTGIKHHIEFTPHLAIKNSMRTDDSALNDFIRNVGIEQNREAIINGTMKIILPEYNFGNLDIYLVRRQGEMNHATATAYQEIIIGLRNYTREFLNTYGDLGVKFNQDILSEI